MNRTKRTELPIYEIIDRGFRVRAWRLEDTETEKGDALVTIERDGSPLREFIYPAYRIYNIAAHFSDIVDGEIKNSSKGYEMANWNGLP
jgi:hypothetical protein